MSSPPKPTLAMRLGITGHRRSRLQDDQLDRIDAQIRSVYGCLAEAIDAAAARFHEEYAPAAPIVYLVSALADGADTLAAERALDRDWRLLAPIPFAIEDYAKDFSEADRSAYESLLNRAYAVAELDGARDTPAKEDRGYLQAGLLTIDQSDIVIAVWDGEEARGVGGTAQIKENALSARKPVIWIHAHDKHPPQLVTPDETMIEFTPERAQALVAAILAPPDSGEIEHAFSGARTPALSAYREFMHERAHRVNWGSFFQFWERLFAGRQPFTSLSVASPKRQIEKARGSTLAQKLRASMVDQEVFNEIILPRFAWADHLAVHYGNLYRSSYFFNYIFAAVAVFLALLDLVAGPFGIGNKTIWISVEVTLIVAILIVTTAGKRGRWHEKWIDYRQLAEELRQYRLYFVTLGRGVADELASGEGGESAGWVDWYFRATRREAGMSSGTFTSENVRSIATTILDEEIRPQIRYHAGKAKTLHAMEHRLHRYGEYAFGATLLVCLVYLSLAFFAAGKETDFEKWAYAAKNDAKGAVTMLTGFLPALGAALFGIRVQGEFASTAERSHATAAQLKAIVDRFETMLGADRPRLEALRQRVDDAARAMLMENMDWRLVYISKPLNLPG